MGVIGIEWIYGIPELPDAPEPEEEGREISPNLWLEWTKTWAVDLLHRLDEEGEDGDELVNILCHMVQLRARRRWPAKKCLMRGLDTGLSRRRRMDGLIVCANDQDDLETGTKTPTLSPPSVRASVLRSGIDPETTIIPGSLWDGGESSDSCRKVLPTLLQQYFSRIIEPCFPTSNFDFV